MEDLSNCSCTDGVSMAQSDRTKSAVETTNTAEETKNETGLMVIVVVDCVQCNGA